jgi:hypothetical protein
MSKYSDSELSSASSQNSRLGEKFLCPEATAFRGGQAQPEQLCRVKQTQVVKKTQLDHNTQGWRKFPDCLIKTLLRFALSIYVEGRWRLTGERPFVHLFVNRNESPGALFTDELLPFVHGNFTEPGEKCGITAKLFESSQRISDCLLKDVVPVGGSPHDSPDECL